MAMPGNPRIVAVSDPGSKAGPYAAVLEQCVWRPGAGDGRNAPRLPEMVAVGDAGQSARWRCRGSLACG